MLATLASLIAFNLPHAVADFIPGAGGSIPAITPLEGTPGQIGRLWVCRVARHNNTFGGGTHANLELHFPTPESIGADPFVLQQSSDGTTAWTNQLFSGEVVQTASGIQDAFYFTPDAGSYYRLLVQGGPHDGNPSNVVYAPPSGIDTQLRKEGRRERFDNTFFSPAEKPGNRLGPKARGQATD